MGFAFGKDNSISRQGYLGPKPREDPNDPRPQTEDDEFALWLKFSEEFRLRYERVHLTAMAGMFPGVTKTWIRRFYDLTFYDEIVPKSTDRQVCEAICITRNIIGCAGHYTVQDAFREYGAAKPWLEKFFLIGEDDILGIDDDAVRKWNPPPEDKAPHAFTYSHIDAPQGIHRKMSYSYKREKRKKILPRKYGHSAGGI